MLRELHTLQQHRICFSSSSTAQNTPLSTSLPHLTISSCHPDKGLLPPQQERLRVAFPSMPIEKGYQDDGIATDEVNRVTERYEGTNKCVILSEHFFGSFSLSPFTQNHRLVIPVTKTWTLFCRQNIYRMILTPRCVLFFGSLVSRLTIMDSCARTFRPSEHLILE